MGLQSNLNSVAEEDHEVIQDRTPVLDWHSPFVYDVHRGQIKDFHKRIVGNEGALCLGNLSELPVEIFDGVCGVNELSYFRRVFKHRGKRVPVNPPGTDMLPLK